MRHVDDQPPTYPTPTTPILPQLFYHQLDFRHLKEQAGDTCKISLGGRTAGHMAPCPAFRYNLPCPNAWKERAEGLPARGAAKGVEGGP